VGVAQTPLSSAAFEGHQERMGGFSAMPKCFFHIRDGNDPWKDEEGVECESMQKMECEVELLMPA
jgi:hypothetical protein